MMTCFGCLAQDPKENWESVGRDDSQSLTEMEGQQVEACIYDAGRVAAKASVDGRIFSAITDQVRNKELTDIGLYNYAPLTRITGETFYIQTSGVTVIYGTRQSRDSIWAEAYCRAPDLVNEIEDVVASAISDMKRAGGTGD